MSNFSRYNTYETPETNQQALPQGPTVRTYGPATQVTLVDGEYVQTSRPKGSYQTANLGADTYGQDDWRAQARNARGNPTTHITRECFVTIDGVQGRVSDFINAGRLREVSPGVIEEATQGASQDVPQVESAEASSDAAQMPDELVSAMNSALEVVPDHALQPLISTAISVAVGKNDMDHLVNRFVSASGLDPVDAMPRAQFLIQNFEAQAVGFLTTRAGVPQASIGEFYEHARSNPRAMEDAIRQQINGNSMAGWRKLASSYLSRVAPTAEAVQAGGLETRKTGSTTEVHLGHGVWADLKTAARLGYI